MGRFTILPHVMRAKDRASAEKALAVLRGSRVVAIDTETTGLDRPRDYAVIISLCSGMNRIVVWPDAFQAFTEYLEDPTLQLIMWNANFDTWMLLNAGIDIYRYTTRPQTRVLDTMIMHILEKDDRPHTLKYACRDILGVNMVEFNTVFGAQMKKRALHEILLDRANEDIVANYAGLDAYATLGCFAYLRKALLQVPTFNEQYPNLWRYFYDTEVPLTKILFENERYGIRVNVGKLIDMAPVFEREIMEAQRWLLRQTGDIQFKVSSPKKLGDLLFGRLGYEPPSRTELGAPRVTDTWLTKKAKQGCEYCREVKRYRENTKKLGTYVTAPLRLIHSDGKIHATFNQGGAATGRLSSRDPNLQNQPPFIRDAFEEEEGWVFGARDYCVSPETRILTADLRWIRADQVPVGMELIGFDENLRLKGHSTKPATVEATRRLRKSCVRIHTDNGTVLTCSSDHMWVVGGGGESCLRRHRQWVAAHMINVGDRIGFFCEPWETLPTRDAGYLAGILDGEGYIAKSGKVGFAQNPNACLIESERILLELGFSAHRRQRSADDVQQIEFYGNRAGMRAVGSLRPPRLLNNSRVLWEGRRTWNSYTPVVRVVRVECIGEQEVIAIQTTTRTFIAEGFLSHNCQLEMRILAHFTRDPALVEPICAGKDVHSSCAAMMYHESYDDIRAALKRADQVEEAIQKGLPYEPLTEREKYLCYKRKGAKSIGFGLIYGMGAQKLADTLGIDIDESRELIDLYFRNLPLVKQYFADDLERAKRFNKTFTLLGRQRHIPDLTSLLRVDQKSGERKVKNTPIQGCQPAHARILTVNGQQPIGAVPDTGVVWTGTAWANYTKLDRGPCELAEVRLSNGHTIECDTRHSVLCSEPDGYVFKHFDELAPGTKVCFSLAAPRYYGDSFLHTGEAYWMGFSVGNGYTGKKRNVLGVSIGDRKDRYSRDEKATECAAWLSSASGGRARVSRCRNKQLTVVSLEMRSWAEHWKSLGYPWGLTYEDKHVPTCIWEACLEDRRDFVLGLLDADGTVGVRGSNTPSLHMCNRPLLADVQVLLRDLGVESVLRDIGDRAFRLDVNGGQAAEFLGYGERDKTVIRMPAPRHLVSKFVSACPLGLWPTGSSNQVLLSRMRSGGTTSVYKLLEMAASAGVDLGDVYAEYEVTSTQRLGREETTYTLCVDNPGHRFDGRGVIHKNSASEIAKMAMIKLYNDPVVTASGAQLLVQIHDEILFRVPERFAEDEAFNAAFIRCMEHPLAYDLIVPLTTSGKYAKTWYGTK